MTDVIENPIASGVKALPHTPVYKMHRYFARRPYNVVSALITHYSRPGDVVLDPFCGGGTTVVEGLRLKRKVIGVDLNPIATFITRCEVMDLELKKLEAAIETVAENARSIRDLYSTRCPACRKIAHVEWTMWSVVYICPHCRTDAVAARSKKLRAGKYECPQCGQPFLVSHLPRARDEMIKQKVVCDACGFRGEKGIVAQDVLLYEALEQNFEAIVEQERLWYPLDEMPEDYDLRKPHNLTCKRFSDFFTRCNLLALARLLKAINALEDRDIRYFMQHVFTSVVSWANRMIIEPHHGWPLHAYWLADTYYEVNVWNLLQRRGMWAVRGKRYSKQEIGDYYVEAASVDNILNGDATCWLLTQSATSLPLPDQSVETIITDPPYGGNVMYSELSNFWAVWLKQPLGLNGLMDNSEEVIKSEYQDKGDSEYEELICSVFKECYRVLKPNGWLVLTFNNRESSVWFALLRALYRAGFHLPQGGIVYQAPIEDYTRTLYQRRDGAMLGDFILSLRKGTQQGRLEPSIVADPEEFILNVIRHLLLEQGEATFSEVYQAVIPELVNCAILDERVMDIDLEELLFNNFAWREVSLNTVDGEVGKNTIRKWTLSNQEQGSIT